MYTKKQRHNIKNIILKLFLILDFLTVFLVEHATPLASDPYYS